MTTFRISRELLTRIVEDYELFAVSLDRIGSGDPSKIGPRLAEFFLSSEIGQRITDRRRRTWDCLESQLGPKEAEELLPLIESLPNWTSRPRRTESSEEDREEGQ